MSLILLLLVATPSPICKGAPIDRMIERYATLVQKQDSGSIAHLFGRDGVIDNPGAAPVRGETAVRSFLGSFKGAVVEAETMTIGDVAAAGPDWRVTGRFHQTGRTPQGKDYDVGGSFDSTWTCGAAGWRIERMSTGK